MMNFEYTRRTLRQIGKLVILSVLFHQSMSANGLQFDELTRQPKAKTSKFLFTELNSDEIGVGGYINNYSGPGLWGKRWSEYILGTIGVGVAVGDFDGDLYPDFFISSKDEGSRLYRNNGDMTFEDFGDLAGFVDSPYPASGCSFVDVDNDGDLDLYLSFVAGKNQLWINDGKGHFEEKAKQWGVDVSSGCTQASFADYDRDGDMDFYLQNNLTSDEAHYERLPDQLFENEGDHFVESTVKAGIIGEGHGHSAIWWDFNEDSWPDIYVANDYRKLDKLYRNNGDGTFTDVFSEVFPQAPYYSMGADFGDIDNDGHTDFWAADMAATTRSQHLRTVGNHLHVYEASPKGEASQYIKNSLFYKASNSRFVEVAFLAGLAESDWTWAPRLIDLNNDGLLDAFVTNGMLRSFHDNELGSTTEENRTGEWLRMVFENESALKERNLAFENMGDLRFESRGKEWGLDKLGVSFGAAFGDFDLDGDLDIVLNNFQDKISVYRNNESESNRVTVYLRGDKSNSYGIGAKVKLVSGDLTQVKELALMRGYMSTDEPVLHFGLGEYDSIDRMEVFWPSGNSQVFEDLAVNRRYTIHEKDTSSVEIETDDKTLFAPSKIELPEEALRKESYYSDFKRQKLLPFRESRIGGEIVLGDLDGDDLTDMIVSGSMGQETTVLRNQGDGVFTHLYSFEMEEDFGCEDWDLELADLDGNGTLDLVAASGGVESAEGDAFFSDRLYSNDGSGEFLKNWDVAFGEMAQSTSVAKAGDFDGDGDLDFFFGGRTVPHKYPNASSSSLWRNDDGKYVRVDESLVPGLANVGRVSDAEWIDIDSDGYLDLLVLREWDTPQIWSNQGDGFTLREDSFDTESLNGLWNCVAIDDLDGDGFLDIVVGNLGLNTEYEASQLEPIRLWYSDGVDGKVKLIETSIIDGQEWTREVKRRLKKSFPREIRSIRSLKAFAEMTLDELFPNLEEKGYRYKEANELRSGILWQGANGRFTFEALPSFAQSGRAMDILIEDIDGDSRKDILISLEQISPEPWTGRFEKGHLGLFNNKGERRFETISAWNSGLLIDGSPRGMAWGDLDDDQSPELTVYLSEGMPVVFSLSK